MGRSRNWKGVNMANQSKMKAGTKALARGMERGAITPDGGGNGELLAADLPARVQACYDEVQDATAALRLAQGRARKAEQAMWDVIGESRDAARSLADNAT